MVVKHQLQLRGYARTARASGATERVGGGSPSGGAGFVEGEKARVMEAR